MSVVSNAHFLLIILHYQFFMQVFLYISLRKRVMGCVFAEGITQVQICGMTYPHGQ